MDVLCTQGCGTVVAQIEIEEGTAAPHLAMLCEVCGVAASQERIAAEEARIKKRLGFLLLVASLSGVDADHITGSPAERVALLEQELGAR